MQSVASTRLAYSPLESLSVPTAKLEVNWSGSTWTDETANMISAQGSISLSNPEDGLTGGGGTMASVAAFVMNNSELANDNPGRYSSLYSSSSLYASISRNKFFGVPIRFSAGYMNGDTAERLRLFTGYIFESDETYPQAQVTWNCADESQKIRHQRVRTILYQNATADELLGYMCDATGVTAPYRSFDTGLFKIPYWWADAEDSWDEMVKLAVQDGGRLYFDHSGVLHFENLHHWLQTEHQTSRWTFTVSDWRAMKPTLAPQDVWDAALVEYAPLQQDYLQVVYQYSGIPLVIPPSSSKTLQCQLQRPCTSIATPYGTKPALTDSGEQTTSDNRDYVFVNAGGDDLNTSITLSLTTYAQHVDIIITNASATHAANLVKLQLRGYPLTGAQVGEVKYDSRLSSVSWPRILEVRGNEIIQTDAQADTLSMFLRDRKETPSLIFTLSNPYCVPQLELGDKVTVVGAFAGNSSAWTKTGYIVAINWQYSVATGFTAEYTILDDANLFTRFSASDVFIVGTNKYGPASTSGSGKIGY